MDALEALDLIVLIAVFQLERLEPGPGGQVRPSGEVELNDLVARSDALFLQVVLEGGHVVRTDAEDVQGFKAFHVRALGPLGRQRTLRDLKSELDARERIVIGRTEDVKVKTEDLTAREMALADLEAAVGERQMAAQAQNAAVAAREDSIEEREGALRQRVEALVEQEAVVEAGMMTLEAERRELDGERHAFDQDIANRMAALEARERALATSETEVSDAVAAIGDVVEQLEQGEISIHQGKLHLGRMPAMVQRIRGVAPADRSPVQRLVVRFVDVLRKMLSSVSGGPDARPTRTDDRPGM